MGLFFAACAAPNGDGTADNGKGSEVFGDQSQDLEILKSDYQIPAEQQLSRIKADYLVQNQGYGENDEVVAILSLKGDALIDTFLGGVRDGSASVGDYATTQRGLEQAKELTRAQNALISDLKAQKLIKSVNYSYTTVLNAVAVTTTYGNFRKLEGMAGIEQAILSDTYSRPQEADESPNASAIVNDVDVYESGIFNSGSVPDTITGETTAVAILDSAFDCSHPVFQIELDESKLLLEKSEIETLLPSTNAIKTTPSLRISDVFYSNKIPFVYDYADKDPDVFPYDSEHGTHVAGIIGGYDEDGYTDKDGNPVVDSEGNRIPFRGVAPKTQLVLLKVFPNLSEGAETEDILAALEDAVLLNVDCINMSLGASCGFAREEDGDAINTVYDKVNESGISLLTAASNSFSSSYGGDQGNTNFVTNPDSGTVGSPSTYEPALSVACISGVKSKYLIANGSQVVFFDESNSISGVANDFFKEIYEAKGWSLTDGAEHTVEYVTVPGVGNRVNYTTLTDNNGKSLVEGKVALVRRGDNTFEDKARQAKNAGALACIIYNNVEGEILMSMGKTDHIPTISISRTSGIEMAKLETGTLVLSYKQQAGPFMSDFSSWGPLPDLSLKPEITAHGGSITSSVPGGTFAELSGTSMATPNLCGIVVLIRQFLKNQPRYSELTWKEISILANEMLMSTAGIILNEEGIPYSPRKQGAGLASLKNVVNAESYLTVEGKDRSKIELYDDPERKGIYEMDFNIVNVSGKAETYDLSLFGMTESVSASDNKHVAETGQQLTGGFEASVDGTGATLENNKLTVSANATAKIKLTYTLSAADKDLIDNLFPYGMYVEGFVKLTATGSTTVSLNIPFLGFYGDWTQAPIFDKTFYEVESEAHDMSIDDEDKIKADYYATTPYGSYFYNYIIPLGSYLYDIDTSAYDPIPATEDHAAISDVYGCIDGISVVYAGLLRNCKTMLYTITDTVTGEVVYTNEVTNSRKAFSQGAGPIPNYEELYIEALQLGLLNNRVYEFKMKGLLDYERDGEFTNVRNTFAFNFTLDNEAPVIKSATYEKEYDRTLKKDRFYINLTVSDNHYAMSVAPFVFTSDNPQKLSISYLTDNPIPLYGEKGEDCTVRIEITDYLEDALLDEMFTNGIGFLVDDYAINQAVYVCQLPGTRGTLKFTTSGLPDGSQLLILQPSLKVGEIVDLTRYLSTTDSTVDADKDYLKYLDWSSSRPEIASVQEGQVLGIKQGTAVITVQNKITRQRANITIPVANRPAAASASVTETDDFAVAPVSQNDIENVETEAIKSLRFSYLDTVHAHARAGQTAGLDTSNIGTTGSRTFISSLPGGVSCYPGESFRLSYDLDPWYVADRYKLTFKSDNTEVATVTEDGIVTALKKGTANISLQVEGSNIMAELRITINSEFVIDDARTLVAYKGRGGEVTIPDDEGILYIGSFAFSLYTTDYDYGERLPEDDFDANKNPSYNNEVTKVIVPDGVEQIQKYAFYNCTALEEVVLPKTIRFIREYAFYEDAKLERINMEDVEVVGARAFFGCEKLGTAVGEHDKTLDLRGAYAIGVSAFEGCESLTYLDLSALRNTGNRAFAGCSSLAEVVLNEHTKLSEEMFAGSGLVDVDLYETNAIPDGLLIDSPHLRSVTMHNGLVSIGLGAFADCAALEEVTLPDSAFTLAGNVFNGCSALSAVKLQKNTRFTSALASTFEGCDALTSFTVDPENTQYGAAAGGKLLVGKTDKTIVFAVPTIADADLEGLSGFDTVGSGAFSGTKITKINLTGFKKISDYAFANCESLAEVTLPADVEIGSNAFNGCTALTTADLSGVKKAGSYAFASTGLKNVTIAAQAEYGEGAFFRSSLETVTIGEGAKFGLGAFQRCTSLRTVNMPAGGGVHFGKVGFAYDSALTSIDLSKTDGIIEDQTFFWCTSLATANLSGVTDIGDFAFANCESLRSVTVTDGLLTIGEGAFSMQEDMNNQVGSAPIFAEFDLPESLTSIGGSAFLGCEQLTSVTIPSKITSVPEMAFGYCTALTTVNLHEGVDTIEGYAFVADASITEIDLSHVKHIGDAAFMSEYMYYLITGEDATGISFTIHQIEEADLSSAEDIGFAAFAGGAICGDYTLPNLKTVGAYAFYKINRSVYSDQNGNQTTYPTLNVFDAPNLESIGYSAFEGNVSMTYFKVYPALKEIMPRAFYDCLALTQFTDKDGNATATVSDYASVADGVLYTRLANGKLQLTSLPAAKNVPALTVQEGTYRIDDYAGSANKTLTSLVLPDSLSYIGDHAFYGCSALNSVEFRSIEAPVLESDDINYVYQLYVLNEGDPGYAILHSEYNLNDFEKYYFNFIDFLGKRAPITMVLPANSDISGYDDIVYLVYFGSVENARRSNYVAMESGMKSFLDLAKQVAALETVSTADERLISAAVSALNSVKQNPTAYGITQEEWDAMVKTVRDAKSKLDRINVGNAPRAVRLVQKLLDALPERYDGTKSCKAKLDEATAAIESLPVDDRSVLILDRYNALLASYNEFVESGALGVGAIVGISVAAGVVALAGVGVALFFVLKKRKQKNA